MGCWTAQRFWGGEQMQPDPQPKLVSRNLANPTSVPVPLEEVHRVRRRPPEQRTRIPLVGEHVLYRHNWYEEPSEAEVEAVDVSNLEDWNVYRVVLDNDGKPVEIDGRRVTEPVEDPWPDLILRTDYGRIVTREARIEGSPGWLPMVRGRV